MKVIEPGHIYGLANFEQDGSPEYTLQFIHKEPVSADSKELKTVANGTTNEEVLAVLIDRLKFLQTKLSDRYSALAITDLQSAENWLKRRTEERKQRGVEGTHAA